LTDQATKEPTFIKTRLCSECGDKVMMPEDRKFTGMETTITYRCSSCDAVAEIRSLSQAGFMAALGALVLTVVTLIAVQGPGYWDMNDYLLYLLFVCAVFGVPVYFLLPHWLYPVTGEAETTATNVDFEDESFIEGYSDPIQRGIIKLERHGFWRGFFTPIIFIVLFLGTAAIIGYINFTYFGN